MVWVVSWGVAGLVCAPGMAVACWPWQLEAATAAAAAAAALPPDVVVCGEIHLHAAAGAPLPGVDPPLEGLWKQHRGLYTWREDGTLERARALGPAKAPDTERHLADEFRRRSVKTFYYKI